MWSLFCPPQISNRPHSAYSLAWPPLLLMHMAAQNPGLPLPNIQPTLSTSGLRALSKKFSLMSNSSLTCCKVEFHFLSVLHQRTEHPKGQVSHAIAKSILSGLALEQELELQDTCMVPKGGSLAGRP